MLPHSLREKGRIQAPYLLVAAGFILIIIAIVMVIAQMPGDNPGVSALKVGQPLNNFTLKDTQGKSVQLSDYQGSIVLLNVWATWCPPCRSEMPTLQAFYNANRKKGFVILSVNAGDSLSDIQAFAQQYNLSFPILMDPKIDLVKRMGIFDYPTSVLIGRDGIVKNIQIGLYQPEMLTQDVSPYLQ